MKINWKVRFRNKTWLAGMISAVITFVYTVLDLLEICPQLTENTVVQMAEALLFLLSATGVIMDPTTEGVGDSQRALGYAKPWSDGV